MAVTGDTILVEPGIYLENLDFGGKGLTLASLYITTQDSSYISQTILDGNEEGTIITLEECAENEVLITGFTLQNGSGKEFINEYYGFYYATYVGGAIYSDNGLLKLHNNRLINNHAGIGGAVSHDGIYNSVNEYTLEIENCFFSGNASIDTGGFALGSGKAGAVKSFGSTLIRDSEFINNSSHDSGVIKISGFETESLLENIQVSNNIGFFNSIMEVNSGTVVCNNSVFSNNINEHTNDVTKNPTINIHGGSLIMNNCTLADNVGYLFGLSSGGNLELENSILWNNADTLVTCFQGFEPNSVSVAYSDFPSGIEAIDLADNANLNWLQGNIDADPLFVDAENGDYHLTANSPCIDAGNTSSPLDPDGTRADMGAYYFDQTVGTDENEVNLLNDVYITNYPNPFNPSGAGRGPSTTISFSLNTESTENTEIEIYNTKGQKITSKPVILSGVEGDKKQTHSVTWNGTDHNNNPVSSGIYIATLKSGGRVLASRKMMVVK